MLSTICIVCREREPRKRWSSSCKELPGKAQVVRIADYSIDNFLNSLYDENVKFNTNTVGDAGACHTNRG